jgi:hypothetical protein
MNYFYMGERNIMDGNYPIKDLSIKKGKFVREIS